MKRRDKIISFIFAASLFCSCNFVSFSQELDLLPISVGKYLEDFLPDMTLVNIFTSPLISLSKPTGGIYDYNFVTSGDSIGYASYWIATYYDTLTYDALSVTIARGAGAQTLSTLVWNIPLLEIFTGVVFSTQKSIEPSIDEFGKFINKLNNIQTHMDGSYVYIFGAGLPESITIRGEKLNFNENEAIFYSQFLLTNVAGNIDMCYQYFDSSDISCNYSSIREVSAGSALLYSKLYPNPASGNTTISLELETACNVKIVLCDLLGQELLQVYDGFTSEGFFTRTFSTEHLAKGVYFLKVMIDGNLVIEKVIVE